MARPQRYLIALGSNVRHHRHGRPPEVLQAALAELQHRGVTIERSSAVMRSAPLGPSRRRYANAAAIVTTSLLPPDLLALCKRVEAAFGRRPGGKRWTARVIDLDLVLWEDGCWRNPGLTIPHPEFHRRAFVLIPARMIAADWRDPRSGLSVRQLHARLTRPRPLPR